MAAPDDLRRAAVKLTEQSRALSEVLDQVVRATGTETWMGPAADRFRWELGQYRWKVDAARQDLWQASRALLARADAADAAVAPPPDPP